MKIISLNVWCGILFEPLMEFLKKHSDDVDVFCFQEMLTTSEEEIKTRADMMFSDRCRMNTFEEMQKILPNHQGYFSVTQDRVNIKGPIDLDSSFGLAIFVRKGLKINRVSDLFVYRSKNAMTVGAATLGRNIQYVEIEKDNRKYTIGHLHGIWNGKGKSDCEERMIQASNTRQFLDKIDGHKVFCGDFNLSPDTESLKIMKTGMIDLIEVNKITSTRSSYYTHDLKFADYMLVSPDINVKKFEVLPDEVSDHLALLLDFE